MAIAYQAKGTATATGGTPLTIPYPASIAAGDLLVLVIVTKFDPDVPSDPSGWTLRGQVAGGAGFNGADRGTIVTSVWTKEAAGTESGSLSVTCSASNNVDYGQIFRYSKGASNTWGIAATTGSDNTVGTSWSVTGAANPGITAGDVILACSGVNTDAYTYSSEDMTATGISAWGTMAEREDSGTITGSDVALIVSEHPVTTGTSSAAPVFTMTGSGSNADSPAGSTVFLRLREISASFVPTTASLTLTTFAPTVTVSNNKLVTPTTASLTLTTFAPTVTTINAVSALTDNFDDNLLDTAKWSDWGDAQTVETNSRLEFTNVNSGTYYGIDSANNYTLDESRAFVELVDPGAHTTYANYEAYPLMLEVDANNKLYWMVSDGFARAYKLVATTFTQVWNATYDATNHRWVQIREASGTTYWETSATGAAGSWTTRHSESTPITHTNLKVVIMVGAWASPGGTTTMIVDNFNTEPPAGTTVTPTTASLSLSTFAPTVTATANKWVTPTTASLTLSTFAPTVFASDNKQAIPSTASLTLTTYEPTVFASDAQQIIPSTASLTLTAYEPTVTATANQWAIPTTASLTLTGYEPTVTSTASSVIVPSTAALTLATFEPTITASDHKAVTPTTASLSLTGYAPTITASDHKQVTPSTVSLSLSTFAPTVSTTVNQFIAPTTASLTLTGYAPTVTTGDFKLVTPTTASLSLTTFAPVVTSTASSIIVPSTVSLSLTTYEPTVTTSDNKTVTPTTASLTLSTFSVAVTATANQTVIPITASLTLTTFAPAVTATDGLRQVIPETTSLALTGYAVTISISNYHADDLVTIRDVSDSLTIRHVLTDQLAIRGVSDNLIIRDVSDSLAIRDKTDSLNVRNKADTLTIN